MNKEETGSAFAPATGYATAVDAALAMSARTKDLMQHEKQYMRNDFECSMHTLADEVRRLRAMLKRARDMLNTPPAAPLEEWPSEPEIDAFVAECDAVLGQSHNEVAERRAQQKGNE